MSKETVAKKFVDEAIASHPVVVFSKTTCPFCKKAKNALEKAGVDKSKMRVEELDNNEHIKEIQDYLLTLTGGRSVPRVFINHKFFGGGDDTQSAYDNGKLKTLLESAGAI